VKKIIKIIKIGLLLLIFGFALALLFSTPGKTIQANLLGTYIPQIGIVNDVYVIKVEARKATDCKQNVEVNVVYNVNNKSYACRLVVQSFRSFEKEEAEQFIKSYKQKGDEITIYISPTSPEKSVLNRIDEIHGWVYFFVFLIFFMVIVSIIWILVSFSKPVLSQQSPKRIHREKANEKNKPIDNIASSDSTAKIVLKSKEEEEKFEKLVMTGDTLKDYYSGAIEKFQLAEFPGYYCTIHLMNNEIITVHQESTHHWTANYNFQAFLDKNELDKLLLTPEELANKELILAKIKTLLHHE
jgi:hypothetical protein